MKINVHSWDGLGSLRSNQQFRQSPYEESENKNMSSGQKYNVNISLIVLFKPPSHSPEAGYKAIWK